MPIFALLPPLIIVAIVIAVSRSAEMRRRQEAQKRGNPEQTFRTAPGTAQQPNVPVRPTVQPTVTAPRTAPQMQPPYAPHTQQNPYAPRTQQQNPYAPRPVQQPRPAPMPKIMHEGHDFCALRPDSPKDKPHPDHDLCALRPEEQTAKESMLKNAPALQCGGTPLNLTPDNIVRGVIFSEIFGKPKALR